VPTALAKPWPSSTSACARQVIIVLIHDGDVERRLRQTFGGGEAAKCGSDDDDAGMSLCCSLRHRTLLVLA
jgi:hypothetical protein